MAHHSCPDQHFLHSHHSQSHTPSNLRIWNKKGKIKNYHTNQQAEIAFLLLLLPLLLLFSSLSVFLIRTSTSSSASSSCTVCKMATMESLIGLVNRIQRACTVLGDYGGGDTALPTLWEALPSVAVVGGQVFPSSTDCASSVCASVRL